MGTYSSKRQKRIENKQQHLPHNNMLYERPAAEPVQALAKSGRRFATIMFALAIVMYFIVNIQRVSIPGQLFDSLQSELSLTASKVAALGTAFMYVYAGTQLLVGLMVDKYGGMRILAGGSLLMAIGALAFPLSNSYWMLVASRVLVGIGSGATYLSLVKETDRLYPHNFAMMMGLCILIGYTGAGLGTMPLAMASKAFGWRNCLLAIAIIGLVTLIAILALWKKVSRPAIRPGKLSFRPHLEGFTNVNNLIEIFSFTVNYGIYFAILTVFGKKFLMDAGGCGEKMASFTSLLMMLVPAALNQISGLLTTYSGNRRRPFFRIMNFFPFLGCGLITVGLLCGPFAGRSILFMASYIILCMVAGFTPITSSLARETNPAEATGTAIGIINFGAYIMVAIAGTITGLILDMFTGTQVSLDGPVVYPSSAYLTIFGLFTVVTALTFCFSLKMPETYGKNIFNNKKIKFLGMSLHS